MDSLYKQISSIKYKPKKLRLKKELLKMYIKNTIIFWRFYPEYELIFNMVLELYFNHTDYLPITCSTSRKKPEFYKKHFGLFPKEAEGVAMSAWIFINRKVFNFNEYNYS